MFPVYAAPENLLGDALKVRTLRGVIVASAPVLGPCAPFDRSLKLPKDRSFTGSPKSASVSEKLVEHIILASARDGDKRLSAMRLASRRARPRVFQSRSS